MRSLARPGWGDCRARPAASRQADSHESAAVQAMINTHDLFMQLAAGTWRLSSYPRPRRY
jgi:hypothetical protein